MMSKQLICILFFTILSVVWCQNPPEKCEAFDESIGDQKIHLYACPEINVTVSKVPESSRTWITVLPVNPEMPVTLKTLPKLKLGDKNEQYDLYLSNLALSKEITYTEILQEMGAPINKITSVMVYACLDFQIEQLKGMTQLWRLQISAVSPKQTFSGFGTHLPGLRSLEISTNEIPEPPIIKGLKYLEEFYLEANMLQEIPDGYFDGVEHLITIYINEFTLSKVPDNLFQKLSNLESLTMYSNVSKLPSLKENPQLRDISFQASPEAQKKLDESYLKNQAFLQTLSLWNAGVTQLEAGVFQGNSKLKVLDLSANQLAEIPSEIFANNPNLENIELSYNNFTELTDNLIPPKLKSLRAVSTPINKFSLGMHPEVKNLEELDLTNAQLSGDLLLLGNFSDIYPTLKIFTLANNRLTSFTIADSIHFNDEIVIDLSNNHIKTIQIVEDKDSPKENLHRIKINLDGNPLVCDCKMKPFLQYLLNKNDEGLKLNVAKDVMCSEPEGKTLLTIDLNCE